MAQRLTNGNTQAFPIGIRPSNNHNTSFLQSGNNIKMTY